MNRRLFAFAALGALCTLLGCSIGYDTLAIDGGVRDAFFVDRAPVDATPDDATAGNDIGTGIDAGAADAGPPSMCPSLMCDPRSPRPCSATPSSACLLKNDGPVCVSTVGHGREGDSCVLDGDCGSSLACFATRTGGRCARVCCAQDAFSCGAPPARCEAPSTLVGSGTSMWGRCVPAPRPCDVLAQDMCDPGEGCYIVSGIGETDCRPVGHIALGETCVNNNDCATELVCTGVGTKKCAQICDMAVSTSCDSLPGTVCRTYAYSPAGTGVCTMPVSSGI